MAFCNRCGALLEEGNAFCTNCGAPLRVAPKVPVRPTAAGPNPARTGTRPVAAKPAGAKAAGVRPAKPTTSGTRPMPHEGVRKKPPVATSTGRVKEYVPEPSYEEEETEETRSKLPIAIIVVLLVLAIGAGGAVLLLGCNKKTASTTAEPTESAEECLKAIQSAIKEQNADKYMETVPTMLVSKDADYISNEFAEAKAEGFDLSTFQYKVDETISCDEKQAKDELKKVLKKYKTKNNVTIDAARKFTLRVSAVQNGEKKAGDAVLVFVQIEGKWYGVWKEFSLDKEGTTEKK